MNVIEGYESPPVPKVENKVKRYNLALPVALYKELQELADSENTTVVELIRRFIKLGLTLARLERTQTGDVIIRQGRREQILKLLI